ncbi:MAG: hypothetical protein GY725_25885 [bacterium]|nr:hypothetical protein [bacterium]
MGDEPDGVAIANTVQLFLAAMIFDDVFKVFQPNLMERDTPPSEYARRHLKFAPFPGEPLGWISEQVGPDLMVCASDYPHPEGTSDPIGKFEKSMPGCNQDDLDKFYYKNMEDVLGMKLASP